MSWGSRSSIRQRKNEVWKEQKMHCESAPPTITEERKNAHVKKAEKRGKRDVLREEGETGDKVHTHWSRLREREGDESMPPSRTASIPGIKMDAFGNVRCCDDGNGLLVFSFDDDDDDVSCVISLSLLEVIGGQSQSGFVSEGQ